MLLILAHENSDFDAVAAQLAAHKLYPAGTPLLARRVNRNVRQFLNLYWDYLPFLRPSEWRRRRVESILLVDTQNVPGVRGVRDHTPVTIIDHHVPAGTIPPGSHHIESLGATTTILVEMLQAAGLALSSIEATLLLLGIYEDSGSLTYDTTTPRDVRATAWLLEQQAQLAIVRRFLEIPLSADQQELYQRLQQGVEWLRPEGQTIAIATATVADEFEEEISAVAHRLRDALAPAGLIVLVQIRQNVQMVARSTVDQLDVAVLARAFGGGGHGRAAAATIMRLPLAQAVAQVKALLPQALKPMVKVSEIMSRGVQTLQTTNIVGQAAELMQRFGHEGYPVIDPQTGQVAGLLTRRAVDRAMSHKMERTPIRQVMKSGRVVVRPADSIERVQQLMLDEDWGQIPVVMGDEGPDQLVGIVTRTDLLRLLSRPGRSGPDSDHRDLLAEQLSPALWDMVQQVSQVASENNIPLYFVGGLVRDLLLGKGPTDLDMVVEGDAIALAKRLQERFGGQLRSHSRFGTAAWRLEPAVWQAIAPTADLSQVPASIDFITARTEFYTQPTALPEVERSSIKLDLHRRDFTINTLAIRLDGAHLGQMLDFYGGRRDLTQGVIRVLHSLSFIDDPTRMLRAVRFEQRLGFAIEPRTAELIGEALPLLERVTGERLKHELQLMLLEARPSPILHRLAELGVLAHIHPALVWPPAGDEWFSRLPIILSRPGWTDGLQGESPASVYFALWLAPLSPTIQIEVMDRLKVRKSTREEVKGVEVMAEILAGFPAGATPGFVEKALRPFALKTRILLASRVIAGDVTPAGAYLDQYVGHWRQVKPILDGNALRSAGLKPGPNFATILDQLLAARLDGQIHSEADEWALVNSQINTPASALLPSLSGRIC